MLDGLLNLYTYIAEKNPDGTFMPFEEIEDIPPGVAESAGLLARAVVRWLVGA